MSSQDIMTIISIGAGLIGVIIGAVLAPFVSHRMENIKAKKSIRPDLVEAIYVFFNLRRGVIVLANEHNYSMRNAQIHFDALNNPNLTPQERNRIEKLYEVLIQAKDNVPMITRYFDQLMELEGKIMALLNQVAIYYGDNEYKVLFDLIKPQIDLSNKPAELYDYKKMTPEQYSSLYGKIYDIAHKEADKLNKVSDEIIAVTTSLLKY